MLGNGNEARAGGVGIGWLRRHFERGRRVKAGQAGHAERVHNAHDSAAAGAALSNHRPLKVATPLIADLPSAPSRLPSHPITHITRIRCAEAEAAIEAGASCSCSCSLPPFSILLPLAVSIIRFTICSASLLFPRVLSHLLHSRYHSSSFPTSSSLVFWESQSPFSVVLAWTIPTPFTTGASACSGLDNGSKGC